MGWLFDFFTAGTARIQALVYAALAMLAVCATLTAAMLWYRGEAIQARGERDLAIAQGQVLAQGLKACNAGVERVEKLAYDAVENSRAMLRQAQLLASGAKQQAMKVEELMKQPPPTRADGRPAGCDDAWDAIEKNARAAP